MAIKTPPLDLYPCPKGQDFTASRDEYFLRLDSFQLYG